jgi:sulfur-oxidizing protein SoxY
MARFAAFCSIILAAFLLASPTLADGRRAGPAQPSAAWQELAETLFPNREIADASAMIEIDAPYRAHDAATVPIDIAIAPPPGRGVARFTLLIDENPAPVAAVVEVGPAMGRDVILSTRIRVDAYSNVRVIAELDDGTLHHAGRFVKASGGCSAPATADPDAPIVDLGRMKLRTFADTDSAAQLLIRHPNHSGFQVDQVTLLAIPPWFVDEVEVRQGPELVMRLAGGISLSENPALRFSYSPNGSSAFEVRVSDTDGGVFKASFPLTGG